MLLEYKTVAIQKEKTLSNGATGDYWKIVRMRIIGNEITYFVSLFTSSAHSFPIWRNAKKYQFILTNEQFDTNLEELGYTLILTKTETMVQELFSEEENLVQFDSDLAEGIII